jgi:glyoxylate reductase
VKPKVLVTRPLFDEAVAFLEEHTEPELASLSPETLSGARGLVCQLTDPVPSTLLDAAPDLEVISNVAVGFDNIGIQAATGRGIVVTNTPEVLTETTADLTFALLMAVARRIVEGDRFLRDGRFRQWEIDLLCGRDIHGRTLGIIGMGRIGRAVARRAEGFGMRVLFTDPGAEASLPLERLLRESDFVSLHVPLTPGTRHLIGKDAFARMKEGAILINTARGPVVDESALADALENGSIAGAALDVFEDEPSVDPRLLERNDVVLTPHIGSASIATRARMCRMAVEDCVAVLQGRRPAHPVNPEVLDRDGSGPA